MKRIVVSVVMLLAVLTLTASASMAGFGPVDPVVRVARGAR